MVILRFGNSKLEDPFSEAFSITTSIGNAVVQTGHNVEVPYAMVRFLLSKLVTRYGSDACFFGVERSKKM